MCCVCGFGVAIELFSFLLLIKFNLKNENDDDDEQKYQIAKYSSLKWVESHFWWCVFSVCIYMHILNLDMSDWCSNHWVLENCQKDKTKWKVMI